MSHQDVVARRDPRVRPRRSPRSSGVAPVGLDRIAFLGSASIQSEGETIQVEALCWPTVATTWTAFSQAWEAVHAARGKPHSTAATMSWLQECAPRLTTPFCDTLAAESSVAALMARTSMQIAVATRSSAAMAVGLRSGGLSECLAVYDEFIRGPGRRPWQLLVTRNPHSGGHPKCAAEVARSRIRLPDALWLSEMQTRIWETVPEPLPLELAHVVAAAVARYCVDDHASNPVFAAVEGKLAHAPFPLKGMTKTKRR